MPWPEHTFRTGSRLRIGQPQTQKIPRKLWPKPSPSRDFCSVPFSAEAVNFPPRRRVSPLPVTFRPCDHPATISAEASMAPSPPCGEVGCHSSPKRSAAGFLSRSFGPQPLGVRITFPIHVPCGPPSRRSGSRVPVTFLCRADLRSRRTSDPGSEPKLSSRSGGAGLRFQNPPFPGCDQFPGRCKMERTRTTCQIQAHSPPNFRDVDLVFASRGADLVPRSYAVLSYQF